LKLGAYEIRAAVHNSSNEELSAICLVEKMVALCLRQATVQNNQKISTLMTIGSRGTIAEVELMAGTCSDSSSCEQIRTYKTNKMSLRKRKRQCQIFFVLEGKQSQDCRPGPIPCCAISNIT
jgi:hypothetical protein